LAAAERARRSAEQERDDLQEEASSSGPKLLVFDILLP